MQKKRNVQKRRDTKKKRRLTYEEWEKLSGSNPKPVKTYKDTVFRKLFSDKKELLVLFNAINGTNYSNVDDLEITTLGNVIYMNVKNDISCIIDMRLNLYEHQSTVNPNMPLRDLEYVSKSYEQYRIGQDIYSTKLIRLPNPKFIVFYNGEEPQPARKEMRLSDAFMHDEAEPSLELIVTQLNINPGYNDELMEKCPTLKEYMLYVDKVRTYQREMSLEEAVSRAVDECIEGGILADFLRRNKSEVISMSLYEYDEKLHERTLMDIGREEGRTEGISIGRTEGISIGRTEGISIGRTEGISIGRTEGISIGRIEGTVTVLRKLGHSDSQITDMLIEAYGLTQNEAEQYI